MSDSRAASTKRSRNTRTLMETAYLAGMLMVLSLFNLPRREWVQAKFQSRLSCISTPHSSSAGSQYDQYTVSYYMI